MPVASRNEWDGRVLGGTVAIATGTDHPTDAVAPKRPTVVAATTSALAVVRPERIGRFLCVHGKARVVCFDAPQIHWQLLAELRFQNDTRGQNALWDVSHHFRLYDVGLLDQRLRLVSTLGFPKPRQLAELLAEYCPGHESMERLESLAATARGENRGSSIAAAGHTAAVVLAVYSAVVPNVESMLRVLRIPAKLASGFGPLGHGIDVQGAVALGSPTRPALSVNAQIAVELVEKAEEVYRRSSAAIYKDLEASYKDLEPRNPFTWQEDQVRRDDEGLPVIADGLLRIWLWRIVNDMRDVHDFRFIPPFDNQERLSILPRRWGILARSHPLLRAWSDLVTAAAAIRWLKSLDDWKEPLKYEIIPRICPPRPDLSMLRRFNGSLFRPRPGHIFLVGQIKHMELRCLARQILRYRPADARIATMFIDGDDPIAQTAIEMRDHNLGDDSEHGRQFRQRPPRDDDWWERTAKVLLAAVPRGLANTQVRTMLDEELERRAPGEADVIHLRSLLTKVHFEFNHFLEDTTLATIARHLGATEDDVWRSLYRPDLTETGGAAIRNVLSGKTEGPRVWKELESLARTQMPKGIVTSRSGGTEASNLLLWWPVAPTGGVGRPEYCTHVRGAEYPLLADQVLKMVLFAVVAAGYEVVAVEGEEFVVELPESEAGSANGIADVANEAAERVLKHLAWGCCKCTRRDSW